MGILEFLDAINNPNKHLPTPIPMRPAGGSLTNLERGAIGNNGRYPLAGSVKEDMLIRDRIGEEEIDDIIRHRFKSRFSTAIDSITGQSWRSPHDQVRQSLQTGKIISSIAERIKEQLKYMQYQPTETEVASGWNPQSNKLKEFQSNRSDEIGNLAGVF